MGRRRREERPKASLVNLNTGLKIELARSQPLIRIALLLLEITEGILRLLFF